MNVLLIFFAIPLAVIILSIILETYMRNPLKVAGVFFSIFIVLAFYLGGTAEYIVAAIVYTVISFIAAYITEYILSRRCCNREIVHNVCRENAINNFETNFELPSAPLATTSDENINFNADYDNRNPFNNCYRRYR